MPKAPPYPEQFRREAIRLLLRGDRTIPELARDLGVSRRRRVLWKSSM